MHFGFIPPTPEMMEEWNQWFEKVADRQVERGHLPCEVEVNATGVQDLTFGADSITGYTIIKADDLDQARDIATEFPFVLSTRVYEIGGSELKRMTRQEEVRRAIQHKEEMCYYGVLIRCNQLRISYHANI